jgi:hypothetical protein
MPLIIKNKSFEEYHIKFDKINRGEDLEISHDFFDSNLSIADFTKMETNTFLDLLYQTKIIKGNSKAIKSFITIDSILK